MHQTNYFHVVTERAMKLNQVLNFTEGTINGVGHRVSKVKRLKNLINPVPTDELDKMILKDLDRWDLIAGRELMLEEVRLKEFPHFPSRMSSLYVSKSYEEALKWGEYFIEIGRKTYQIVEIECKGNVFTGDAKNCWYETPSREASMVMAKHYWHNQQNIDNEEPVLETIINGEIKIVKIHKTFEVD